MNIHSFTITNNDTPDYINKNLNKKVTILLDVMDKIYLDEWQNVYYLYTCIDQIIYFEKGCSFNIFMPAQINTLTSFLLSDYPIRLEYSLTNSIPETFIKKPYKIIVD